jgi:hypothetical protein
VRIILPPRIHRQLKEIVFATRKETGACLFGVYDEAGDARVLHIAGPGTKSKHFSFNYQGDVDHYEDVYNELLKENPKLEHLGEFHVHPGNMSELSSGDLQTIKTVLKTYERFIAGIILRRHAPDSWWFGVGKGDWCLFEKGMRGIRIYPMYFSKQKPEGEELELIIE